MWSGWERSVGARLTREGVLEEELQNWVLTDGFRFGMVKGVIGENINLG